MIEALNVKPVVGMDVTFKGYVTLWSGQELDAPFGQIAIVRKDEIVVVFEEVVSDQGGHIYVDYATVAVDAIPETLEGFDWLPE